MEASKSPCSEEDEDYIEMELTTSSSISTPARPSSSKKSTEFEFQMSTILHEKESATPCPADELFYKGQLLPLQLLPRLLMVQKLIMQRREQNQPCFGSTKHAADDEEHECTSIPTFITTTLTNPSTPVQSCDIPPAESCRSSCELNPDEYSIQRSTGLSGFLAHHTEKSWPNRFWLINQSSLSHKLKASRAYLKSLFIKSAVACSDESSVSAKEAEVQEQGNVQPNDNEHLSKYIKVGSDIPLGQFDKQVADEDGFLGPRRSFSGVIKRNCRAKCLSSSSSTSSSTDSPSNSSSFSIKSNGFYEIDFLKKSSSLHSEIENAIEAAIAHCKRSQQQQQQQQQQQHCSIKAETRTGSGLTSSVAEVAACEVNAKSELSRI